MTRDRSYPNVRGIVFSALFSALLVVLSFVHIQLPFSPVPITLQNLAIMLAGTILGAVYGFYSVLTVVVLVALGLPLLHGQGGLPLLLGPTGGFIWMYPLSALVIGFLAGRVRGSGPAAYGLTFLAAWIGNLLLYVTGVPWLAHSLDVSIPRALALGCYPYLPGDTAKAVLAAIIAVPVKQLFPMRAVLSGGRGVIRSPQAARDRAEQPDELR